MKAYSQLNIRWSGQTLGTCAGWKIKNGGCFITSLCMLHDGTITNPRGQNVICHPGILDWVATTEKLYTSGCNVVADKFAKRLGFKLYTKTTNKPNIPCIAETNYYRSKGIPQHFFIWYPDNTILDPLDGTLSNLWTPKQKKNPYNIVSYRVFSR